jgi:uncharacterized repeat protein (TIGR03809 family)
MAHRSDVARGREIIERWCVLAEQRLDYLTDLFESGRWRRFYSEIAFLENIQEAKTAVETWRRLLTKEGSSDNSAIDTSWLDRRRTIPPRQASILRHEVRPTLPRSMQIVGERAAPEPLVDLTSEATPSDQTASASSADDNAWERELDLSVMQQRYPLLRNTL